MKNNAKKMPTYTRWDQLPILLDLPIVVVLLGMSEPTIKKLAVAGKLPGARKIGDQWRFDKQSLHEFITGKEGQS